jgi:hydrogenase maturation protease
MKKNIQTGSANLPDIFEDKSDKILVLGIGNYLMGDEGIGVHIVQRMEQMELPDYVDVLDGGTGGFFLMGVFDEYGKVIFVDATMDGQPAGTIKVIKPKFASDFPKSLSVHDVGLKDMVEALFLQDHFAELHLVTVSITEMHPMYVGLTGPVEKCIPQAIDTILKLAEKIHEPADK